MHNASLKAFLKKGVSKNIQLLFPLPMLNINLGFRMVSIIDSFNPFRLFKEPILSRHCRKQAVPCSNLLPIV